MNRNDLQWRMVYLALMALMLPFALLPIRISSQAGAMIGGLLYYVLPKWRRIGIRAVSASMPYMQTHPCWNSASGSPERIIRQLYHNIGILLSEISRLYFGNFSPLVETVEFRGLEHYEAAKRKGRGIIAITAHSGNWELMAVALAVKVTPIAVVARNMSKSYFDRALERIRLRHGNRVIYRDGGVKEMFQLLKENKILGILPDQVVKAPHGILADFLGRPCWTTVMPAKLALKTGSPLIPFFMHREGDRYIFTMHPEIQLMAAGSDEERILDGVTKMNAAIEQQIIRYPDQWNWLYRRWKGVKTQPEATTDS